jgi:hypothetical protein
MKARDWYGLAIRIAGLVFFVYAGFDVAHLIAPLTGADVPSQYPLSSVKFAAMSYFIFGLILTFGAGLVVRLVYGAEKPD